MWATMCVQRWIVALAVVGSVACGGPARPATSASATAQPSSPKEPLPAFLDLIPADTAYAFGVFSRATTPSSREFQKAFAEGVLSAIAEEAPSPATRVAAALLKALEGEISEHMLSEVGIDPNARFALWGLGLMPVARVELADGEKTRAAIERLLEDAGVEVPLQKLGEKEYWWLDSETGAAGIVVAVVDDELALALVAGSAREATLPYVLGTKRPPRSMADSRELAEIQASYQFRGDGLLGFINTVRAAQALTHEQRGTHPPMWSEIARFSSPACQHELPALFETVPRIVLGSDVAGDSRTAVRLIIETRPDITKKLNRMVSAVPGLSVDAAREAAVAIGLGVHVGQAMKFIAASASAFGKAEHRCPGLAELEDEMLMASSQIALAGISAISGIRGFNIVLSELDLEDGAAPRVAGTVVVAADNPQALVGLVSNLWPVFQGVTVVPDAPPVALKTPGIPPEAGPVYIAMTDIAIGLSAGPDAMTTLTATLATAPVADPPMFVMSFNAEGFAERIANPENPGNAQDATSARYDSLWVGSITDQGIVLDLQLVKASPSQ